LLATSALFGPTFSRNAAAQTCGAAMTTAAAPHGASLTASNALAVLRAAVNLRACLRCICDVNNSGSTTTTDALTVLRGAVGLQVTLACPTCPALPDPAGLAAASCAFVARCEPARLDFANESIDDCVARQQASLAAQFAAVGDAMAAGHVEFVAEDYDACEAAFAAADCDLGVEPCDYLRGLRTEGQACSLSAECASGLFCDAAPNTCGVCRSVGAVGEACSDVVCVAHARCLLVGADALCIAADLGEGAPCGTVETGVCRGHLQCIGTNPTCQRPAEPGQTCDELEETAPSCDVLDGFVCENQTCSQATFNPPGGSCAGASSCDVDGRCDLGTSFCRAFPGAGEDCYFGQCALGHFCDATNDCQPQVGQGASCEYNGACRANLFCVGSEPARTCQPLAFVDCP
jgi:hypothetical protein